MSKDAIPHEQGQLRNQLLRTGVAAAVLMCAYSAAWTFLQMWSALRQLRLARWGSFAVGEVVEIGRDGVRYRFDTRDRIACEGVTRLCEVDGLRLTTGVSLLVLYSPANPACNAAWRELAPWIRWESGA